MTHYEKYVDSVEALAELVCQLDLEGCLYCDKVYCQDYNDDGICNNYGNGCKAAAINWLNAEIVEELT